MNKVLVTGGNGFIGSHLVEHLVNIGVSVICLIRKVSDLRWLEGFNVEYIFGDITDYCSLNLDGSGVDTVFHLAGLNKSFTDQDYYKANMKGTENLMKALIHSNLKLKRFLYISSQAAVGPSSHDHPVTEFDTPNPVTTYGMSKLAGEEVVLGFSSQIPVTIIRPPVVYGPRDIDCYEFFRLVQKGIKPILGLKDWYGSFIYVEDLIRGLILAAENPTAIGQTYFIVSDFKVSLQELNNEIARALKKKAITVHIPISLSMIIAVFSELVSKLRRKPSIVNRQKIREIRERFWICDGSRAIEELRFRPKYSLQQGIEMTAAWYTDMGWL